ncbi:MAG: DPP IV N-terminal domain-containing protein [Candidatus Acidiferrales bacterium]
MHSFRNARAVQIFLAGWLACAAFITIPVARAQSATNSGEKDLTVERIYGEPSLNGETLRGVEWAPDGKRLSYFRAAHDGRDLVVVDAETGRSRVLVAAEKLASLMPPPKKQVAQRTGFGRATAARYLWAPDGKSLLFVGGGSLVLFNAETSASKKLVSGEQEIGDPKFSPDGQWISYVRDYNVWAVNVATGASHAVTTGGSEALRKGQVDWVYPEELDLGTAYWWSPDSKRIAYLQFDESPVTPYPIIDMASMTGQTLTTRYPQAGSPNPILRVGVISVNGGETTWMDTGSNTNVYLPRVKWLPNSQQLAIQRLNRAQNRLDLMFADASSGTSKIILTETDKYWINLSEDLYFFSDGSKFLWSSERTGYRHLYLYSIEGKELEQLTSGDWQISDISGFGPGGENGIAVDEANGYVYFPSNKGDTRDLQFYRLALADKSLTRITKSDGTHNVKLAPGARYFEDTFSTAKVPPTEDLYRIDGARVTVLQGNNLPELAEYHLSPVKFPKIQADDGVTLYAKMILPRNFDASKKYPVLINVYGGPHAQEVRNAWGGVDFLWHELMAEKGYIIFTVDNRGSYGRGHLFETPLYHNFGKIELQDQLAGVRWLKSQSFVDPSRIGIWGWSYGGYMTLYSILNVPGVFKAAVSVAPVTDWKLYDTIYTERYMGTPQENPEGYKNSSPVTYASHLQTQLMEVHGTGDDNVHFANTAEMLNGFIAAGKYPAALMVFPGRGHPISDHPARIQLFERITEFFLKNL